VVSSRATRRALYVLIAAGGLFPLGYLVYGFAVLELGRDAGIELAETWVLTPLGGAMIAGVGGVAAMLAIRLVRRGPACARRPARRRRPPQPLDRCRARESGDRHRRHGGCRRSERCSSPCS